MRKHEVLEVTDSEIAFILRQAYEGTAVLESMSEGGYLGSDAVGR
jgi:hypothetical protein